MPSSCALSARAVRRPSTCPRARSGWCCRGCVPGATSTCALRWTMTASAPRTRICSISWCSACAGAVRNWSNPRRPSAACRILGGSAREVTRMLSASRLVRVAGPLPARRPDITRGADPRSLIGYVECNDDGDDGAAAVGLRPDRLGVPRAVACSRSQNGPPFNFLCIPPPERNRDLGMSVLVVGARFCRRHHALLLVDPPLAWDTTQDALDGNTRLAIPQR